MSTQNPAAVAPRRNVTEPVKGKPAQAAAPASTPAIPAPGTTPAAPTVVKAKKSLSMTLHGGTQELTVLTFRTKDGWRTEVTHFATKAVKGERRSGARGATMTAADFAGAQANHQKAIDAAVKIGWEKPVKQALGLVRREDTFTLANLPKPSKK